MKPESKVALLEQADYYLKKLMNYENSQFGFKTDLRLYDNEAL
jgi:hypothetical protein